MGIGNSIIVFIFVLYFIYKTDGIKNYINLLLFKEKNIPIWFPILIHSYQIWGIINLFY